MNDYWKGLIEYSKKRDREEKMKNTLKEIGSLLVEVGITIVVILLATHALLTAFAFSAFGDEVLTPSERVVALTLLGEARGEHMTGIYAVGCVIQKRAANRNLTPAQVCQESWQFSIWNAGKGKVKKESELYYLWDKKNYPKYKFFVPYARQLARNICKNKKLERQEATGNANHYHTKSAKPYWSKGKKPIKQIGNHLFFKLP